MLLASASAETQAQMGWLLGGILYSSTYAIIGSLLRGHPVLLSWFRAGALLIPPMAGAVVIVRRRQTWRGCQWLFWATIAVGLAMSALGLTGWAADELMFQRDTWLAWPVVFALFGGIAPLFALLAQPHRGTREPLAATTAVDVAGLTVVTGFLYSFFVSAPNGTSSAPLSLQAVSVLQQALVVAGMLAAMWVARQTPWQNTYRRLALGGLVAFVTLAISNVGSGQGLYRSGFVYDLAWILPFAFFPWAASAAPASDGESGVSDGEELVRPRPWVIFTAVALLPFLDYGLRRISPDATPEGFRDLSIAVTLISVLPLLIARIAAERAELQQAGGTTRLLAEVIEQAQDLILVMTPDGRVRHANSAFCRAIGRSHKELTSLNLRDLAMFETISADDILTQVRAGSQWRGTIIRARADSTTYPVQATFTAIIDGRGAATHIVSVERDITEERRLREQLIHSERLSAVGQLVAGVAHEINNPLQAVMGFAELLIGAETSPDIRRDLEQIRVDANRAAKIVRHLLLFARRSTLERSVADLNEIARSTAALRVNQLQAFNVELVEQYSNDLPLLVVNREEIQQIVLNLLINAEQSVRSTGQVGRIRLTTGEAGGSAYVEVSDDGPGVPAMVASRIFEPFFTTKEIGQGTGLGLSVSLGIAQAHGGNLEMRPTAYGACFRLTLPCASEMRMDMALANSA
jgi:PAS domain S-box-containing protein